MTKFFRTLLVYSFFYSISASGFVYLWLELSSPSPHENISPIRWILTDDQKFDSIITALVLSFPFVFLGSFLSWLLSEPKHNFSWAIILAIAYSAAFAVASLLFFEGYDARVAQVSGASYGILTSLLGSLLAHKLQFKLSKHAR